MSGNRPHLRFDPLEGGEVEEDFEEFPDGFYVVSAETGYWVGPFETDEERADYTGPAGTGVVDSDRFIHLARPLDVTKEPDRP